MNGEFGMSNWIGANRCRIGGKNVWEKQEDVPPGWGDSERNICHGWGTD